MADFVTDDLTELAASDTEELTELAADVIEAWTEEAADESDARTEEAATALLPTNAEFVPIEVEEAILLL